MEIINQVEAKNKGIVIIESCENKDHLEVAYNYILLYLNKFEDILGFSEMERLITKKIETLE
jgi:hypothetical protein